MKLGIDRRASVLLSSATFWLCACQGELAVVDTLPSGGADLTQDPSNDGDVPSVADDTSSDGDTPNAAVDTAGDGELPADLPLDDASDGDVPDESSSDDEAPAMATPCSCGNSPSLQALGCELGEVPLVENDVVQTTRDGGVVAFTACGATQCSVARWTAAGGTTVVGEGWLTGLSAAGDHLLFSEGTVEASGMTLIDLNGQRIDTGLSETPGDNMLSASGEVVIAQKIIDNVAYLARWSAGEVELIQRFDPGVARVYASPDGNTIVGTGDLTDPSSSFRWTARDGISFGLPGLPAGVSIWPQALSSDGSVIAGLAFPSLTDFRWSEASGLELITSSSGRSETFLSSDGAIVAGSSGAGDDPESSRAFYWQGIGGAQVLTPGIATQLIDLSDDGRIAVASSIDLDVTYFWDETNGAHSLEDLLDARGVDRTGWTLGVARVLSGDGKVVLGLGTCGGSPTLYRVEL
jgi:hypothetical protein